MIEDLLKLLGGVLGFGVGARLAFGGDDSSELATPEGDVIAGAAAVVAPSGASAGLTDYVKDKILRVMAQIESGGLRYSVVYIRPGIEFSYGLLQTRLRTGGIAKILQAYIKRGGQYSSHFSPYMQRVNAKDGSLESAQNFIALLRLAGQDRTMQAVQKEYFFSNYLNPAWSWVKERGFTLPIAYLVAADTFIHSGGAWPFKSALGSSSFQVTQADQSGYLERYLNWRYQWLKNKGGVLAASAHRPALFLSLLRSDPYLRGPIQVRNTTIN